MSAAQGAAPPPEGVTPNFEHPQDVLRTVNMVSGILTISLMAPFVLMRLYVRKVTHTFAKEDVICLVAWLLSTGYCLTGILMGIHGGGNHQYEVTKANMRGFSQALYANTIVYGLTALSTKSTLLLIFARVFAPFKRTVTFIYVFIGGMVLYYVPVLIMKSMVCLPIRGFWDPEIHSKCIDQRALFETDTITSAITDLVILILPVPLTWRIRVPLIQKFKIMALLGAGGLATAASVVRLILVFQPNSFADETVTFVRFNLLGVAEMGIGIICACLPSLNVFFRANSENSSRRAPYSSGGVKLSTWRGLKGETPSPHAEAGSARDVLLLEMEDQKTNTTGTHTTLEVPQRTHSISQHAPGNRRLWDGPWDGGKEDVEAGQMTEYKP